LRKTIEIWMHRPAPVKWWRILYPLLEDSGLTVARMSSPTAWMALSDVDSAQVDEILELVQSATEVTNRDFVSFYRDDDDWPRIVDQGWAEEDRSGPRP
jgi:hypothetical protein